jgi:hypothetical protein
LQHLDLSESTRVDEKIEEIRKERNPKVTSLFKSEIVAKALEKGNQSVINGFSEILPNIVPFSDHVFVQICPHCKCTKAPQLLLPYLKRDMVIPVLGVPYSEYPKEFAETVLSFPHVSFQEYSEGRNYVLRQRNQRLMPSEEISSIERKCQLFVDRQFSNKDEIQWWHEHVTTIFANMEPFFYPDNEILRNLSTFLKEKSLQKIDHVFQLSCIVNIFRDSQVFSLVPQIEIEQVDELKLVSQYEDGELNFDVTDIKNSIMGGLKLSYNPKLPIEPYLDFVSERKSRIVSIVENIIHAAHPENRAFLTNLQAEIEKINYEVEKLQGSTRAKTVDLVTNFAMQNKSIIAGLITAASMGIGGLGLIGCGAGIASGLTAKVLSKKANIVVPKEAYTLAGRFATFVEPRYEKLLASAFSSDIVPVQVWQIRKRLNRAH